MFAWRQEGILFNAAKPLVVLVIRQATELIIPRNGSVLPEQKIFFGFLLRITKAKETSTVSLKGISGTLSGSGTD